jgi:hypothetical protein
MSICDLPQVISVTSRDVQPPPFIAIIRNEAWRCVIIERQPPNLAKYQCVVALSYHSIFTGRTNMPKAMRKAVAKSKTHAKTKSSLGRKANNTTPQAATNKKSKSKTLFLLRC